MLFNLKLTKLFDIQLMLSATPVMRESHSGLKLRDLIVEISRWALGNKYTITMDPHSTATSTKETSSPLMRKQQQYRKLYGHRTKNAHTVRTWMQPQKKMHIIQKLTIKGWLQTDQNSDEQLAELRATINSKADGYSYRVVNTKTNRMFLVTSRGSIGL